MPYVHELPGWPALHWSSEALARPLASVRHAQGRHLGRMEGLGFDLRREASLTTLTNDVVKSSAIEGEVLEPDQVRSSIASRLGLDTAGLPRPAREVDGVVEMMLDATQRFDEELTEERLFAWHAALFPTGRSSMGSITVGAWRTEASGPMQVVSGPMGRAKVHFEAPHADRIPAEAAAFLHWFNGPPAIDPVLAAGVTHFWFVTIHPFEDGNGRIARAIGDMALARADGTRERTYSLSTQIEAERNRYYDELEAAQRSSLDITPWLLWFLDCLDRAIASAESMLERVLRKARIWSTLQARPVHERQRKVLGLLLEDFRGKLTTSKYAKLCKCSRDTALRDVQDLVERGVLARNTGGGRSTSYSLVDPG